MFASEKNDGSLEAIFKILQGDMKPDAGGVFTNEKELLPENEFVQLNIELDSFTMGLNVLEFI